MDNLTLGKFTSDFEGASKNFDFVKVELTLKENVKQHETNKEIEVPVATGFLAGIFQTYINRRQCIFIILTTDFKNHTLYNTDLFNILSFTYRIDSIRTLLLFNADILDQNNAVALLRKIKEKMSTDRTMFKYSTFVDVSKYDVSAAEMMFINAESLATYIETDYAELYTKALRTMGGSPSGTNNGTVAGNIRARTYNNNAWENRTTHTATNTTQKEPLFFKRTLTKAIKKTVDKLKEMPTNTPIDWGGLALKDATPEEEDKSKRKTVCVFDDEDDDNLSDYGRFLSGMV